MMNTRLGIISPMTTQEPSSWRANTEKPSAIPKGMAIAIDRPKPRKIRISVAPRCRQISGFWMSCIR